jgi:hypothetical protein
MSLIEAATNVIVGYILAVLTQVLVFPWFGIETGLGDHLAIGLVFLAVSLIRSYCLRRLFNAVLDADGSDQELVRYTRFPPKGRSQG